MDKSGAKINMAIHHFGIRMFFFNDHFNGKNKLQRLGKLGHYLQKKIKLFIEC